jgi:hypothetical protein
MSPWDVSGVLSVDEPNGSLLGGDVETAAAHHLLFSGFRFEPDIQAEATTSM